ncbi:thioredoxin family protein, partial [Staphylococcus chromogenes]|uniref:thioredoxin family protein n=1 Tax=Staphylococcus chromogenes TaxID=46126 RepID=UPI000D1A2D6C
KDGCKDAMMNITNLNHNSENLNLEVHAIYGDENTDRIDQYLTNGKSRSIPIFIFMNEQFEQLAVWGPRAQSVQKFVTSVREALPDKSHPDFSDKEKEVHQPIRNRYLTDHTFWNDVYESILKTLQ